MNGMACQPTAMPPVVAAMGPGYGPNGYGPNGPPVVAAMADPNFGREIPDAGVSDASDAGDAGVQATDAGAPAVSARERQIAPPVVAAFTRPPDPAPEPPPPKKKK